MGDINVNYVLELPHWPLRAPGEPNLSKTFCVNDMDGAKEIANED